MTPSYNGQMSQLCHTSILGEATPRQRDQYALLVRAMRQGISEAKPGSSMSRVCSEINKVLEAEGYGEYCHPSHIRRRGHGLGFSSILPGSVEPANTMELKEGMFFVVHPNQYLPDTGYMMCGEPVLLESRDLVEGLVARTGCSVTLMGIYGERIVTIHHERGTEGLEINYDRGRVMPLFKGGPSKAILAFLPKARVKRLYERHRDELHLDVRRRGF